MDTHASLLVYKELADCYDQKGEASMRDRFLVLAADAALAAGMPDEAERLRQRLLQVNPHHLLRPYANFAQALQAPDVQTYVRDLRLNYPLDTAESLLRAVRDEATVPAAAEEDAPPAQVPSATKPIFQVREEPRLAPRPPTVARTIAPRKAIPLPAPSAPAAAPPTRASKPALASVPLAKPVAKPAPPTRQPAAAPPFKAPAAPRPSASRRPAEEPPPGGWFSSFLFGVFLLAAAAVAVFTLGRPFLPAGWLP
jgi:hypothetical protein